MTVRGKVTAFRRRDAEQSGQAGSPGRGQPHRARIALARDPAQSDAAAADLGTDPACQVIAPLAPIETGLAKDALARRARRQVRTERQEESPAAVRHLA